MRRYWINQKGVQSGPFDIEELKQKSLDSDTFVWYSGMPDWKPADEVDELKALVTAVQLVEPLPQEQPVSETTAQPPVFPEPVQESVAPICEQRPVAQPPAYSGDAVVTPQTPYSYPPLPTPECPPTNLVWAIISTVCCCTPLGIVAIVFAAQVRSKFNCGDFKKAQKYSEMSAWFCILAIVLGIVAIPVSLLSLFP